VKDSQHQGGTAELASIRSLNDAEYEGKGMGHAGGNGQFVVYGFYGRKTYFSTKSPNHSLGEVALLLSPLIDRGIPKAWRQKAVSMWKVFFFLFFPYPQLGRDQAPFHF